MCQQGIRSEHQRFQLSYIAPYLLTSSSEMKEEKKDAAACRSPAPPRFLRQYEGKGGTETKMRGQGKREMREEKDIK